MSIFVSTVLLGFVLFILYENYVHKKRIQCIMDNRPKVNCKKLGSLMGVESLETVRDASKAFARGTWLL